jgi:hypothetical protein
VLTGDLADKSKPKAGSGRACSRRTIEWREYALSLALGDTGPAIAHRQDSAQPLPANPDLNRRRSMLLGIFDEVPDHPLQKGRVAANDDGLPRHTGL